MKCAILLLALIPLVFSAPEKRMLLDSLPHIGDLFNLSVIKDTIQHLVNVAASDETEQACEAQCHSFLTGDHEASLIHTLCTPVCQSLHSLAAHYNIVAQPAA